MYNLLWRWSAVKSVADANSETNHPLLSVKLAGEFLILSMHKRFGLNKPTCYYWALSKKAT